jgi:hypothetical protein
MNAWLDRIDPGVVPPDVQGWLAIYIDSISTWPQTACIPILAFLTDNMIIGSP